MRVNPWLLGGGVAAAALLLVGGRALARPISRPGRVSSRDLDALANMLITETGFRKSKKEMAAIVFIAVNRSQGQNKPLWYVVQPGNRPKGSCPGRREDRCLQWNAGANYRRRFENARSNSRWIAARDFAASIVNGTSGFRNTGATSFVHPGHPNFNIPCKDNPQVRKGWWSPSYVPGYGTRCIPKWAQKGTVIGTGLFA